MKKISLILLLAGSLIANDKNDYFSVGAGQTTFSTTDSDDRGVSYTGELGHYYSDKGRFSAGFTYVNSSKNVTKSNIVLIKYDYIIPLYSDLVSAYFGPALGYTSLKTSNLDLSGVSYGAQLGLMLNIADTFELDLGARYLGQQAELLKSTTMLYANLNIRFNYEDLY